MKISRIHLLIALLAVCAFVCSCSESGDDIMQNGKDAVKVTMSLSSRAAAGVPYNPETNSELINDYCVVFADKGGNVVEVFSKDCSPVEVDEFTLELAPGTYHVYAFANIPESYVTSLGLAKGSRIAGFPTSLVSTYYPVPGAFNTSALVPADEFVGNIPMTSFEAKEITISERATQSFGIEVRRLFAKLQFDYTNATSDDLALRAQSVSNLTINGAGNKGAVRVMNYDDSQILLSTDARVATLTHSYSSPMLLTANGGIGTKTFYVLESIADRLTNSFMLDFDVVKEGEDPSDAVDYMRYALTDPSTLTMIRRNDWIRIPVVFSDWQMRLEAHTYPPIGGYPEAEIDELESNEFVVKFDGSGDFAIRPFIRKRLDGSAWFGLDERTKVAGAPVITIEDRSLMFLKTPEFKSTGEILGTMRTSKGNSATINISVDVVVSEAPYVTKTLQRKIFVTQK